MISEYLTHLSSYFDLFNDKKLTCLNVCKDSCPHIIIEIETSYMLI